MATYRSIVGHKINKVSSDPAEPLTGQMWYNSTTASLRGLGLIEAFSSASPIITAATKGAGFGPVGGPNIPSWTTYVSSPYPSKKMQKVKQSQQWR